MNVKRYFMSVDTWEKVREEFGIERADQRLFGMDVFISPYVPPGEVWIVGEPVKKERPSDER